MRSFALRLAVPTVLLAWAGCGSWNAKPINQVVPQLDGKRSVAVAWNGDTVIVARARVVRDTLVGIETVSQRAIAIPMSGVRALGLREVTAMDAVVLAGWGIVLGYYIAMALLSPAT